MPETVFICPNCGSSIEVDESLLGSDAECPNCKVSIEIPSASIEPGAEVGGFVLERKLGEGGMGQVWLAHHISMDRKVALKILSPDLTRNPEFVKRFTKEVKTSAKLLHPNIVAAFDAGQDKGIYYLAVEYVEGIELGARLKMDGRIPESESLRIARDVASGLAYAWEKFKIIHRDIKPANIIIEPNGKAKIMDLGISKNLSEDSSMTMTGVMVGTPYYVSPEQAKGEKTIDFRADIYSLGATLYQLMTGVTPFDGETAISIITKHVVEKLVSARERKGDVSEECSALIDKMMRKDPATRHGSWQEVIEDIDSILGGRGVAVSAKSPFGRSVKILAAGILLALALFVVTVSVARKKSGRKNGSSASATEMPIGKDLMEDGKKDVPKDSGTVRPVKEVSVSPGPEMAKPVERAGKADLPQPVQQKEKGVADRLLESLMKANPGLRESSCRINEEEDNIKLVVRDAELSDISSLRDFKISVLDISGTDVKDISALSGLPLVRLEMSGSKVSDISPLKGMPLKHLSMASIPATDYSPVFSLDLETLVFSPAKFKPQDMKRLHDQMSLKHIDIEDKPDGELMGADEFWASFREKVRDRIQNGRQPSGRNPPMRR